MRCNMEFLFDAIKQIRSNIWESVKNLSMKQLHQTPSGMSNNIAWNLGHIVVSQQILCYRLANIPLLTPDSFLELYAKNTSPKNWDKTVNVQEIQEYFISTADALKKDYAAKLFHNFAEYKTSSGLVLKNIDDALIYNYGHENLHYGNIMILKKLVSEPFK